ncbi:MAG: hypothetical protein ACI9MC_000080 [Kiritimatiellia bacterium]|jgi:hypothetical protein
MTFRTIALLTALPVIASSCGTPPDGLRLTPEGAGPLVVVDWDADPLPEIPFPNDLATRPDPTSVTGLRVNISLEATTHQEAEARAKFNELVGFGIFSPITVRFSAPLDLDNVAGRHPDDFEVADHWNDDALLVINVDPDSPDYLKPFPLDMGHGRFPADVARTDRYFTNDPRSDSPSIIFEMGEEDLNGNGILDPGEDTDNDGILDHPNVYPLGGDPRADMLTWYERETNTLIARPVVPLLEETRYAVVLTSRLVDDNGEPVRSPWKWINHTRQTDALLPLEQALPKLGMSTDDVAYAWTFTTGRVTGDLIDIYRGLHGDGPWPFLQDDYPARIEEAHQLHTRDNLPSTYRLPMSSLITELNDLGMFPDESGPYLSASYKSFTGDLVGGVFTTPYLLTDRDDGGYDDSDEWWQLDPVAGTMSVGPQRVPFTCALPAEHLGFDKPYPVVLTGHGYGSSRFDFLGFAHAFNRVGIAACGMDFPGHGPTLKPDQDLLVTALLATKGLLPFKFHLFDGRYRDLSNNGISDSGGDQWSADSFHTRDMVRQGVVDWMQMIRSMQTCGEGSMDLVEQKEDGPHPTGDVAVTCDWDDDGQPDIGGPDAKYYIVGGSLGGIDSAVAAGVIPDVTAWAPFAPGGGTLDIGIRTQIGGAVEALVGRFVTPMFVGIPTEDGGLRIEQHVVSVTDIERLPVANLPDIPVGGRVTVENLDNGEVRTGMIPDDGRFRLSIPADGLDHFEKRVAAGIPLDGPLPDATPGQVADNEGLGDRFVITVFDAAGQETAHLNSWETDVVHEGVLMPAGSPLVAGSHGLGHIRGSSDVRRLAMVISSAIEPGDAISYAPLWHDRPPTVIRSEPINMLLQPSIGDKIVNINAGIALARAGGLYVWDVKDDRYDMTIDQWLVDRGVVQGLERYGPWRNSAGQPVLFDPDDADDSTDGFEAPSDAPLRATRKTTSGTSGLRLTYSEITGSHTFGLPEPGRPFDASTFHTNQIAWYFATDGKELLDDPCLATSDCDFLHPIQWPEGE